MFDVVTTFGQERTPDVYESRSDSRTSLQRQVEHQKAPQYGRAITLSFGTMGLTQDYPRAGNGLYPVITQIWGTLDWFISLMLLIGLLESPWAKGYIGEFLVRLFAHWQLDKQTYRRLDNVTLNTPDGTTQIDHVFLSVGGSAFKTEVLANVTQGIGFIRYVKSFQQSVFSEAEVDAMLQSCKPVAAHQLSPPTASIYKALIAEVMRQLNGNNQNAAACY